MKTLIFISLIFSNTIAYGEISSIKINSFFRIGHQTISSPMLTEVCGTVVADEAVKVIITTDPRSSKPARYTVLTDQNNKFCQIVATFAGSVEAIAISMDNNGANNVKSKIYLLKQTK